MIYLFLKSYFKEILTISLSSIAILLIGFYFIFRNSSQSIKRTEPKLEPVAPTKKLTSEPPQDEYTAIAGEDLVATKLDLARAYLEAGRIALAKTLLQQVMDNGSDVQQQEAKKILTAVQS